MTSCRRRPRDMFDIFGVMRRLQRLMSVSRRAAVNRHHRIVKHVTRAGVAFLLRPTAAVRLKHGSHQRINVSQQRSTNATTKTTVQGSKETYVSSRNVTKRRFLLIPGLLSWWLHWLGVGLVVERSQVRLPAGALSSQLGQLNLPFLRVR